MYKTVIFFLDNGPGTPEWISHDEYVRLVRGEKPVPTYSGRQVRVADWYVRMDGDRPVEIENETYSFLNFDRTGHVAWPSEGPGSRQSQAGDGAREGNHLHGNAKELAWAPTPEERAMLHAMVFVSRERQG